MLSVVGRELYRDNALVVEFGVVVALLVVLHLWAGVVGPVATALPTVVPGPWALGVQATVASAGAFVALGVGYALVRGVEMPVAPPSLASLPSVVVAVVVPAALVLLTDLVAGLAGTTYGEQAGMFAATRPPLDVFAVLGVWIPVVVGVSLAVLYQGAVQGTFARAVDDRRAALATVAVAGVPVLNGSGFTLHPGVGDLAFLLVALVALGVGVYGSTRVDDRRLAAAAFVPFALLVAVAGGEWLLVERLPGIAFGASGILVLGVAADAYDRTGSLWVPALAYATYTTAGYAVTSLLEAGTVA